jgi:hypothetical protein
MTIPLRRASHSRVYAEAPQLTDADGSRHWITRAANFAIVVSEVASGAVIARSGQPDEYMAFLVTGAATAEAGGQKHEADAETLLIVPPGDSKITVREAGRLVRIFSGKTVDILAQAGNAATYADGAPEVTKTVPWPDPVGGFKLRAYDLKTTISPDPHPLGMRIYRSTNLMVNIFMKWSKRRDATRLSPHSHDDFEQMSLGLAGGFVHHLHYPWGPDMTKWMDDEHAVYADSPSVLVIPAGVVHTTQDVGSGMTWLVDVFGPPRVDFSSKPGLVINAAEYPMPSA